MRIQDLFALKNTLNKIEVHGSTNLDMLLGCMQTVDKLIQEEQTNAEHDQAE